MPNLRKPLSGEGCSDFGMGAYHLSEGVFILMAQNALLTGFQLPHCQGTQIIHLQK